MASIPSSGQPVGDGGARFRLRAIAPRTFLLFSTICALRACTPTRMVVTREFARELALDRRGFFPLALWVIIPSTGWQVKYARNLCCLIDRRRLVRCRLHPSGHGA